MIFQNKIEDKIAEQYIRRKYSSVTKKKVEKPQKKRSMVRDVIDNPDNYELNAKIVDGEIVIKISKRLKEKK